jgi:hypothetical protein
MQCVASPDIGFIKIALYKLNILFTLFSSQACNLISNYEDDDDEEDVKDTDEGSTIKPGRCMS